MRRRIESVSWIGLTLALRRNKVFGYKDPRVPGFSRVPSEKTPSTHCLNRGEILSNSRPAAAHKKQKATNTERSRLDI